MGTSRSFVFSQFANVNYQFMTLFKALDELETREPGTPEYRGHLLSLAGLLRYQFAFEEDIMAGSGFPGMPEHVEDHNRLRRVLAGLLDVNEEMDTELIAFQERFRDVLRTHCQGSDNDLIAHLGSLHGDTTVVLRSKSRAIVKEG